MTGWLIIELWKWWKSGCLMWGTLPLVTGGIEEKQVTPVKITNVRAEIWNCNLRDTKQNCYLLGEFNVHLTEECEYMHVTLFLLTFAQNWRTVVGLPFLYPMLLNWFQQQLVLGVSSLGVSLYPWKFAKSLLHYVNPKNKFIKISQI